eukprot:TRINITY_DN66970_c9_g6_i1.p2 TRINITY_DN66970_c9_g6~~TRINITY_DN66970_c9_g6_i1.p2  ORF type:complete len:268 (+),score=23.97 TRINITY_DN66970_c9_g6_i1:36-806(+)
MAAGKKLSSMEGLQVPDCTFHLYDDGKWSKLTTDMLFVGKTVVVFAVAGAFCSTCTNAMVPRYNELTPYFKANGVDDVICVAVNDPFVVEEWKKMLKADKLIFLPDGNGEWTQGMGMLVEKQGFGLRSWRYSMLVKNGVVRKQFIEPDELGDPFKISSADYMFEYINPDAPAPLDVTIFTKEGDTLCNKAKQALKAAKLEFEEVVIAPGTNVTTRTILALCGTTAVPQVFINGKHIGGSESLNSYLAHSKGLLQLL